MRVQGPLDLLRGVPLFAAVGDAELEQLAARSATRSYRRGQTVWRVGEEGDELVVVASGSLHVWGAASDTVPIARLDPGAYAGELALLLHEPRSATVTCARAAEVLAIPKDAFREVVLGDAKVLSQLTDELSRRAMSNARGVVAPRPPIVVGVAARDGAQGSSLVAGMVAAVTSAMLPTLLVRFVPGGATVAKLVAGKARPQPGATEAARLDVSPAAATPTQLLALVEHLVTGAEAARVIVLDLPRGSFEAATEACDAVVGVTAERSESRGQTTANGTRVYDVVNRYPEADAPAMPLNHCEPFVLGHEPELKGLDAEAAVAALLASPDLAMARTLGRLARKLLGVSVGLALGGGAAFGIAHVGVLVALEEAGLPVDIVAGTSMGSIIAIGHAAGISGEEMTAIASRIGNVRTTLSVIDPTLSGAGVLSGRRLVAIFSPLLTAQRFEDLVMPCRVVALDVGTGERVDIGSGRLDMAFRASCSIPLVFTPVKDGERSLVDGGMIDPVPVDVARDMGADIVIGVNVVPKLERGVTTALQRTFKRLNQLNPLARFGGGRDLPDLVDVLMNSLQVVEYELGAYKQVDADVRVDVSLAEFTWIEFYRAMEIIERGHEAGAVAVDGLRAELERRLV